MAGIGFALKRLGDHESLMSKSMAAGHAILISSGPWIVIMAGIAVLSAFITPVLGTDQIRAFNILVIYGFALSLMITAPIALEATLRVSALLYRRQFEKVQAVYLGALVLSSAIALIGGSIVYVVWLRLESHLAIAALCCLLQVALLWIAMAFVAAIRQYALVTLAFAIGLSSALLLGIAAAGLGYGSAGVLLGFSAGICIAFCILNFLIVHTFPGSLPPLVSLWRVIRASKLYSITFFVAGLTSALAVWIDKLVVWGSREGVAIGTGLFHAPRYDSSVFIAYLAIVPVMSVVVIWLETSFFDSFRHYRDIIHSGGTLRQIEEQRKRLLQETVEGISTAFRIQIVVSISLALVSPWLASLAGFPFEALPVLRLAFVGAAFHLLFQASCGVILFVQYGRAYLMLQGLFLGLNGTLTAALIYNPDYLGLGYVLASLISSVVAYLVMVRMLSNLNHLTFVINNPSVSGSRS